MDLESTIFAVPERAAMERVRRPLGKGWARLADRFGGVLSVLTEFMPRHAMRAELAGKMHLARGMFPQVYDEALRRLGDEGLADAFARQFVREEIGRMWPTVGNHPLARLWNEVVPFSVYMIRNRTLFISEALAHPAVLNWFEWAGRFIEEENRRRWAEEHPGEPFPEWAARRIELPWAPGVYLDLSVFSDAARGLAPVYRAASGDRLIDFVADWVRLVNPGAQAGALMLTNAIGVTRRFVWVPEFDEAGFLVGYHREERGWTEPWSRRDPSLASVFWFIEAFESAKPYFEGGLSLGEATLVLGRLLTFNGLRQVDRGAVLYEAYVAMRAKDREAADRWLRATDEGKLVQAWLLGRGGEREVANWYLLWGNPKRWGSWFDPKAWFHARSPEFRERVAAGYRQIRAIRESYERVLAGLEPGTAEYRQKKAEMLSAINSIYLANPALVEYEVWSKSPAEWAAQLARWQLRAKLDEYFALDAQRPARADYEKADDYYAALDAWRRQKQVFLAAHPQVAEELGTARTALERVRERSEAEWTAVLDRVEARSREIARLEAKGERDRSDLLRLANELDISRLDREFVELAFSPADLRELFKDRRRLWSGRIKDLVSVLDFRRARYEKAKREGRLAEFLEQERYAEGMAAVIRAAKGGNPFGKFDPARFVAALRADPELLELYFKRNPGKREEWARNEAYIRYIGAWGRAAAARDWERARRIWERLPQWVKDRYFEAHPGKREQWARSAEYVRLIAPWGKAAARGDWEEADRIWASLPQWVKDRYERRHPDRRAKSVQSALYVGAMREWVRLLEGSGRKAALDYFWGLPGWMRERYFARHPGKRVELEAELRFGAQLAEYFAADPAMRDRVLAKYPDLGGWLAKRVTSDEARRIAILVAYRSIPKGEGWLKAVFRQRYPEVFSREAIGERRLRRVYEKLVDHPEMLPPFERWVEAIWDTYAVRRLVPAVPEIAFKLVRPRRMGSRSAAETSA
jgi:hypothetical protein